MKLGNRLASCWFVALAWLSFLACSSAPPPAPDVDCGCDRMTLKYKNAVGGAWSATYCVDSAESFSECREVNPNPCGAGKKGWQCPIGGAYGNDGKPWIGVGFEVVADIPNGTDLDDCVFGQGIQRDITEDGQLQDNDPTGHATPTGVVDYYQSTNRLYSSTATAIPNVGTTNADGKMKFAADSYDAVVATQTIAYTNHQLSWSDFPAVYVDGDTNKQVVVTDRFLAFVRDKDTGASLCAYRFKLVGTKNSGGDSLSSATLTQETGDDCVFSAQ